MNERRKSLLDLLPIFTRLRRQKTTALAAKSLATQAKESVSLRSLLRADPFYFFPHESPLYEFGTPCMVIILEYEQSLFFLNSPPSKTRETSK